ncbi:MAG TPA: hypothetical protein VK483_07220 [Chitinophagaceae bacterium]|nr:hypothetical protein [Chitinophagaceae bacterium]
MSAKAILLALFSFSSLYSSGQARLIATTTQNNSDRSVSIFANSQAYADYTLKITFTSLDGYTSRSLFTSNIALVTVSPGYAEVIKLLPENSARSFSYQFKSQYFPGRAFRRMPDTSFQYLLPGSTGNHLRVSSVSSTVSLLSQKLGSQYRGTGFVYKLNDTICASRAGTVFECSDTAKLGEKGGVIFTSGRNRIAIEHRDGTLGIYGITAPIQLLVSPGDVVFPGQPLAIFNKESEKYTLLFSTCYLDEKKLLADNSPDNKLYFIYIPTHFYGNENEPSTVLQVNNGYTVQHPVNIIAAEMSKKEKKKFGY